MKRRFFTLFEVMIVLSILVVAFGVLTLNFPKLSREKRWEEEVDKIRREIALCYEVMLNYDTDVIFQIREESEELVCQLMCSKTLPCPPAPLVLKETKMIEAPPLHFLAHDALTPTGTIVLTSKGGKTATLKLPPYPASLQGKKDEIKAQTTYPEAIVSTH